MNISYFFSDGSAGSIEGSSGGLGSSSVGLPSSDSSTLSSQRRQLGDRLYPKVVALQPVSLTFY